MKHAKGTVVGLRKQSNGLVCAFSRFDQENWHFHNISQAFDDNMFSCFVFYDVSKAFDRVSNKGILFKLRQNGIEGKPLEWLNSCLSQRKQKVGLMSCY